MINTDKTKRFEALFARLYPRIKRFAYTLLKSEPDAEDIAQDIFVKLWALPGCWLNQELPDAYIYKMTKNAVMNFIRHKYVEENFCTNQKNGLSEAGSDLHEELFAKELGLRLDAAVAAMPTQRRKVFEMTKIDGMSMDEVAEQLSLSKRTVERHLYLAMTDLKKIIEIFLLFHCVDWLCCVSY